MHARAPKKSDLDPIEVASRDEITALQLKRLKWTLRRAGHVERAAMCRVGFAPEANKMPMSMCRTPCCRNGKVAQSGRGNHSALSPQGARG